MKWISICFFTGRLFLIEFFDRRLLREEIHWWTLSRKWKQMFNWHFTLALQSRRAFYLREGEVNDKTRGYEPSLSTFLLQPKGTSLAELRDIFRWKCPVLSTFERHPFQTEFFLLHRFSIIWLKTTKNRFVFNVLRLENERCLSVKISRYQKYV